MNKRWRIATLLVIGVCFLLPLAVYSFLGSYNRWIADDYCEAAYVKTGGVFIGSIMLYISWTGRFFASIIGTWLTSLGPGAAPYVPAAVIIIWLAVLAWTLHQVAATQGWSLRGLSAITLAVVILSTTVQISPKVDQPLFWMQAMADTIPALVLGTLFAGLVIYFRRVKPPAPTEPRNTISVETFRRNVSTAPVLDKNLAQGRGKNISTAPLSKKKPAHGIWRNVLYFSIAFVAGGVSETYATAQTSAFMLLIIAAILFASADDINESLPWMLAGFLGSAFAIVLNLAAPGNIGHQRLYAPVPGAPGLIKITLTSLSQIATRTLTRPLSLGAALSLIGVAMLAGAGLLFDPRPIKLSRRSLLAALIYLPLITLIEITACLVPAAYGQSTPPPDRTLIVPYYLLVCALAIWGYLAGQYITIVIARKPRDEAISFRHRHQKWNILAGGLILVLGVTSLFSAAQIMQLRPAISQFAAAWDRSHSLIVDAQTRGLAEVTVPPFPNWAGIEDISPDTSFWVNRCVKIYYGIEVKTQ